MTRDEFINLMKAEYSAEPDYPWDDSPHAVFRHRVSHKWFALLMEIPERLLGLPGDEVISVVNVKIDKLLGYELRQIPGIYPAYHMNKVHWVTMDLRALNREIVLKMLDMSFKLTAGKKDI